MNKEIDNTEKPKTQRKYFELLFCNDKYGKNAMFNFTHGKEDLCKLNNIIMSEDITACLKKPFWTLRDIIELINIIIKPREHIDVELVNVETVLDEDRKTLHRFYHFVVKY